jgi:uncharacterized membrane protein YtjA (UPF0391 family)
MKMRIGPWDDHGGTRLPRGRYTRSAHPGGWARVLNVAAFALAVIAVVAQESGPHTSIVLRAVLGFGGLASADLAVLRQIFRRIRR